MVAIVTILIVLEKQTNFFLKRLGMGKSAEIGRERVIRGRGRQEGRRKKTGMGRGWERGRG